MLMEAVWSCGAVGDYDCPLCVSGQQTPRTEMQSAAGNNWKPTSLATSRM